MHFPILILVLFLYLLVCCISQFSYWLQHYHILFYLIACDKDYRIKILLLLMVLWH